MPCGSKVQSPFSAATDASKPCEQQPTLRRCKEAKDVDSTDSANAGEWMRHKLTAIAVLAISTSFLEGAPSLAAVRTGRGNAPGVPGTKPRARKKS